MRDRQTLMARTTRAVGPLGGVRTLGVRAAWGPTVWFLGGALWVANGLLGLSAAKGSTVFYRTEAVWLFVHLLIGAGLVALRASDAGDGTGSARIGMTLALAGRGVFVVAEITAIVVADDNIFLFPVAALLTVFGMLTFGAAVLRARHWHRWHRFAPLAMGIYPLVAMFPFLAITGKRPNLGVSGWGLTFVGIGIALAQAGANARER